MSSHKLRVNPKRVRGEIVIPTINYPIQSGHIVMLEEEDFQKSDIQASLKNGFLIEEPINVDVIVPDEAFIDAPDSLFREDFEEEELFREDFEEEEEVEDLIPEPPTKKSKVLFRSKNVKGQDINEVVREINKKTAARDDEFEIDPRDFDNTHTTPMVWDGSNQQALTAQEGRKKVMSDLSTTDLSVQSGDINFDVQEPIKKNYKKTRKKFQKKTLPVPDLGDIDLVYEKTVPDLGFVDQEQAAARIADHPVLSKKTKKVKKTRVKKAKMNEEIE
jgi:hypothetical protein